MKSERRLLINELRALKKRGVYDGPITTDSGCEQTTPNAKPPAATEKKSAPVSSVQSKQLSTDESVVVRFLRYSCVTCDRYTTRCCMSYARQGKKSRQFLNCWKVIQVSYPTALISHDMLQQMENCYPCFSTLRPLCKAHMLNYNHI